MHLTKIWSEEKSEEKEAEDSRRPLVVACSNFLKVWTQDLYFFFIQSYAFLFFFSSLGVTVGVCCVLFVIEH